MSAIPSLRIGVDVGGTNTDAVILDLSAGSSRPVLANYKTTTTPDVASGIQEAIRQTLLKANVNKDIIQAVSIGTTSFVNSLIERDASKLERVAVIRLSGPFGKLAPPFVSFPNELRRLLEGPCFFAEGGLQVDGSEISPVNPLQIRSICAEIRRQGIQTVAISGCYSPIDRIILQEELVRDIVRAEIPGIKVCISKEVAHIGLLQRENATILNAALLKFAQTTIAGFTQSARTLDLSCPLFLTSNDGTLLSCEEAAKFPIKTFSSGPTNSMRGANFLANLGDHDRPKETALVMDIGGTTTEVGVLLPTGFPRQASATHELCGVPLNFSMPHVHSVGLGGGSRVRKDHKGTTTIGPDSVGYKIQELGLIFGGDVFTTTDAIVAATQLKSIGNADLVKDIPEDEVRAARQRIRQMLEAAVDGMKTSAQDVPVYLVGGGAILVPDTLKGVSKIHRFPFCEAANAVGAACAQISGTIDTFEDTSKLSVEEVQRIVEQSAIDKAIAAGADPERTVVVESQAIPIAYTTGRCRFYVKAAGDWTGAAKSVVEETMEDAAGPSARSWDTTSHVVPARPANIDQEIPATDLAITADDILGYKPQVQQGEWQLSELDIEWIATGCYILGTGGGGNPHGIYLAIRELMRKGSIVRVVDINTLDQDKVVMYGGGIGSPEVASEKLVSGKIGDTARALLRFMNMDNLGAMAAVEIGGGNGMVAMLSGSSSDLNVPIIDGDFMGRAYPTGWQTTVNVYAEDDQATMVLPSLMDSGDGTQMLLTKAKHYKDVDNVLRAACMEMGTSASVVARPLTKPQSERALIRNTVSQSWRIGRAVALANRQGNIDNIGQVLVDALGGPEASRVLFEGKIVHVGRRLHKGHSYGEIEIHALAGIDAISEPENTRTRFKGVMKSESKLPLVHAEATVSVPFKNENLLAEHIVDGQTEVVCGVPDLISVLDAQNGTALGTPEYKYGLRVIVIGITAAPQWTDTARGLELGSLSAFGYDIPYRPLGRYVKPRSVIEEYSS
ncbi:hydantoinase [Kwoniella heveanensis BCC8398]|uniref:Hydantoinase n=1 Tax=Kwoniella heveanensis BCC8398 TaxID=1296120 RepID=A0A1B9GLZ0_9TREE|nr:hydantoinase [Kwoniella heveanensis BCC8398]